VTGPSTPEQSTPAYALVIGPAVTLVDVIASPPSTKWGTELSLRLCSSRHFPACVHRLSLLTGAAPGGPLEDVASAAASALDGLCAAHGCAREALRGVGADAQQRLEALHRAQGITLCGSRLLEVLDGPADDLTNSSTSMAESTFDAVCEAAVSARVLDQPRVDQMTDVLASYLGDEARERAIERILASPPLFAPHTRVELAGLAARPELNGQQGTIAAPFRRGADGSLRFPVSLPVGDGAPMLVRAVNLRLLEQGRQGRNGGGKTEETDVFAEPIKPLRVASAAEDAAARARAGAAHAAHKQRMQASDNDAGNATPSEAIWEYEANGVWEPYPSELNKQIEGLYSMGSPQYLYRPGRPECEGMYDPDAINGFLVGRRPHDQCATHRIVFGEGREVFMYAGGGRRVRRRGPAADAAHMEFMRGLVPGEVDAGGCRREAGAQQRWERH